MMKKPIIGITPDYSYEKTRFKISEDYTNALLKAGGVPVLLFPGEDFPDFVDGILFTGGGDIDPLRFGEEPIRQNGQISPLRDEYELSLCKEAMERNLPLFGVCRGMQIMNIAAGGGIYQDIEVQTGTTLKHSQQAPQHYHHSRQSAGKTLANLKNRRQFPAPSGSIFSGKRLPRLCPQCRRPDGSHGNARKRLCTGCPVASGIHAYKRTGGIVQPLCAGGFPLP